MNMRRNRIIKTIVVMLISVLATSCTVFGSSPDTKDTPIIEAKLELMEEAVPSDDTSIDIAVINKTGHEIEHIELRLIDEEADTDYEFPDLNKENNLLKKNDTFKFLETRKLNIRISFEVKTDSEKKDTPVILIFKLKDDEETYIIHDFPVNDTVDAGIYLDKGIVFLHYISTASGDEVNTFEEEVKKQDSVQSVSDYDYVQGRPSPEDNNNYVLDDEPSYVQHVHDYVYDYGTYQVGACGTYASIKLVCECGDYYVEEFPWDDSMHDTGCMELIEHQIFHDEDGFYCGEEFTYRCPACGYEWSYGLE